MKIVASVVLIVVLELVIEASAKRREYCDYERHKYYSEAVGGCKKCDPCPIGEGIVKTDLEIDSEKGALTCRNCRACDDGYFQKRHKAFRKCRPCKICNVLTEKEVRKCTNKQNRKCRRIRHKERTTTQLSPTTEKFSADIVTNYDRPVAEPIMGPPASIPKPTTATSVTIIEKNFQDHKAAFVVATVFASLFIVVIAIILATVFRKRMICRRQRTELRALEFPQRENASSTDTTNEANPETEYTEVGESSFPQPVALNEQQQNEARKNKDDDTEKDQNRRSLINKSQPVCTRNRLQSTSENYESSIPFLPSRFDYSLDTEPKFSFLKHNFSNVRNECVEKRKTDMMQKQNKETGEIWLKRSKETCLPGNIPTFVEETSIDDVTNDGNSCQSFETEDETLKPVALQNVAHQIAAGSCYEKVGRALGLTDNEIGIINSNHQDVEYAAYHVLNKWKQKKGCSATRGVLKSVLIELGRGDVADSL